MMMIIGMMSSDGDKCPCSNLSCLHTHTQATITSDLLYRYIYRSIISQHPTSANKSISARKMQRSNERPQANDLFNVFGE